MGLHYDKSLKLVKMIKHEKQVLISSLANF